MEKSEKYTDGLTYYFLDNNRISIDDFMRLEYIAALENEMLKYKIFFVYKLDEGLKVFTSLN